MQNETCQRLVGDKAPRFERNSTGGIITSWDLSGRRPRLLVFCPSLDDAQCMDYLEKIAADQEEYDRLEAVVVVITAGDAGRPGATALPVIAGARDLYAQFGLVDPEGGARPGVIVIDRYGMVDSCFTGAEFMDLPPESSIIARLTSAEAECPECGVAERRWTEA
jgi:alkyl hydroperoxide reductase subunit AhpC